MIIKILVLIPSPFCLIGRCCCEIKKYTIIWAHKDGEPFSGDRFEVLVVEY